TTISTLSLHDALPIYYLWAVFAVNREFVVFARLRTVTRRDEPGAVRYAWFPGVGLPTFAGGNSPERRSRRCLSRQVIRVKSPMRSEEHTSELQSLAYL